MKGERGKRWEWGLGKGREQEAESTTASDSVLVAALLASRPFCSGGLGNTTKDLASIYIYIRIWRTRAACVSSVLFSSLSSPVFEGSGGERERRGDGRKDRRGVSP